MNKSHTFQAVNDGILIVKNAVEYIQTFLQITRFRLYNTFIQQNCFVLEKSVLYTVFVVYAIAIAVYFGLAFGGLAKRQLVIR
jgi:hypothetical protein